MEIQNLLQNEGTQVLSKRELLAAIAMHALIIDRGDALVPLSATARDAVRHADALLIELEQPKEENNEKA